MFELGDAAEAALAYLVMHQPNCLCINDEIIVQGILELK